MEPSDIPRGMRRIYRRFARWRNAHLGVRLPIPEIEDGDEDEPWPANLVLGSAELLRFSRIRQLLRSW